MTELVTISNLNPLSKLPAKWSCELAITITLKPLMYKKTFEEQDSILRPLILGMFKNCKLTLVWELTKTYNIHYHGMIQVPMHLCNDPLKYIFDRLRSCSKIGKCEVNQVVNYDLWISYLNKDIKMNEALGYYTKVIDEYDVLSSGDTGE